MKPLLCQTSPRKGGRRGGGRGGRGTSSSLSHARETPPSSPKSFSSVKTYIFIFPKQLVRRLARPLFFSAPVSRLSETRGRFWRVRKSSCEAAARPVVSPEPSEEENMAAVLPARSHCLRLKDAALFCLSSCFLKRRWRRRRRQSWRETLQQWVRPVDATGADCGTRVKPERG